jgi:hypothetical protein
MCAAGGGDFKPYRLRFPLNPDEVIPGCCESFICNNLSFSFENYAIMPNPIFTVPYPVLQRDSLYWYETLVR